MKGKGIFSKVIIAMTMLLSGGLATTLTLSLTGQLSLTSPDKTYSCDFLNDDNILLYHCEVEPSHTAVYRGETPTKEPDGHFTYRFTGWDNELTSINDNSVFHALFEAIPNSYRVTFIDYNEEILYQTYVTLGSVAYYPYDNPTRPSTNQHTYVFTGWDKDINKPITDDTIFQAQYDINDTLYRVYFYDYDETLLYQTRVHYGENATYDGPELVGPEEVPGYTYKFSGWSDSVNNITEDKAVIATYLLERNQYVVTYHNYDNLVLYVDEVYYGDDSIYRGKEPYRPSDDKYSYTFTGWDIDTSAVKSDLDVYAQFAQDQPLYTVTFKDLNDNILYTCQVPIGETATYRGEIPTKPETEKYTYDFIGWDRDLQSIKANFVTYPVFEENQRMYEITFLNYDGSELFVAEVPYGANALSYYEGPRPTRLQDDTYYYTFKGWDEDVSAITGDMETIALFDAHLIKVPTGNNDEGQGGSNGDEGEGGGGGGGGGFGPPPQLCTVTFRNYNGIRLDVDAVITGRDARYDNELPLPQREGDARYQNYEFVSWDRPLNAVETSFTTYAQYKITDDIFDKYILTFRNDNGELLYEAVFEENEVPVYPEYLTPTSGKSDYAIFKCWDRAITRSGSSYTVYAEYEYLPPPAGGGSGGTGGDMGFPGDMSDEPVLTVNTDYQGTFYLREKSYSNIKNNSWQDMEPYEGPSSEMPLYLTANLMDQHHVAFPQYDISITYNDYHYYQLMPMYTFDMIDGVNDVYAPGVLEKDFDYTFSPLDISRASYNILNALNYDSTSLSGFESNYAQYVHENYLTVSSRQRAFLTEFIAENHLTVDTIDDIINVKDFLKNYAEYNLQGAPYPTDVDYIIYFLQEAKYGICNHFNSALTMLYRTMGLPARYVTGYLVNSKGGETVVTTKRAHGWSEIYLDGIGWVTIDAVPAAGGEGGGGEGGGGGGGQGGEGGEGGEGGQGEGGKRNYNPFGDLVGEPLLTFTYLPESASKEFDGESMNINIDVEGEYLEEGHHAVFLPDEMSDVGNYLTRVAVSIKDANGQDVTEMYAHRVLIVNNSFKITQRTIVIETASASKSRDGTPLIKDEYVFLDDTSLVEGHVLNIDFTGEQTDIGVSANTIDFNTLAVYDAKGINVTRNYRIIVHFGLLRVV